MMDTLHDTWIDVVAFDALPQRRGRVVFAAGRTLAAWRIGDAVHVLDDACPHAGASLAGGRMDGCVVQCPAHGLRFDVRSGDCMVGGARLAVRSHRVKVEGGRVFVALAAARAQTTIAPVAPSTETIAPDT